jgi:hypothetical protein
VVPRGPEDPASARKDLTVTVLDETGTALQRYFVQGALPSAYYENGQRVVLAVAAQVVQRVAL